MSCLSMMPLDISYTYFSKLMHHNVNGCRFSFCGKYFAVATLSQLFIRDVKSFDLIHLFLCDDHIELVQWSPDSKFILCGTLKKNLIQVWSLEDFNWSCKITESVLKIIDICWSPDSRHILTTAQFHTRVQIWSLTSKSVLYILSPLKGKPGLDFSTNGKYLAVADKIDPNNAVCIFVCGTWELLKHFEIDCQYFGGLLWSPDNTTLCVWEYSLLECKILFYCMDGRCIGKCLPSNSFFGIKCAAWSSVGRYFAFGCYDQKLRIIPQYKWSDCIEVKIPSTVVSSKVVVYKMSSNAADSPMYSSEAWHKYDVIKERPFIISDTRTSSSLNDSGVGKLEISSNERYIALLCDNMPCSVFIYDTEDAMIQCLIHHDQPIKCFAWSPHEALLAICTGSENISFWSPLCTVVTRMPFRDQFSTNSLKWHPTENIIIVTEKDRSSLHYFL